MSSITSATPRTSATSATATPTPGTFDIPTNTWSTNAGPLITPMAMPSNCLNELWNLNTPGLRPSTSLTYFTQGCAMSTCCPSGTPYSKPYEWLSTYYSPAVCPQSYKSCAPPASFAVDEGERVGFCCPQAYNCPGDPALNRSGWWACLSLMESTTWANVIENPQTQNFLSTETIGATRVGFINIAYPIQVRWKAEDSSLFTTSATSATGSPTGSATITDTASSDGNDNPYKSSNPSAIIVTSVLTVLLVGALAFAAFLFFRRKRGSPAVAGRGPDVQQMAYQPAYQQVQPVYQDQHIPQGGYQDQRGGYQDIQPAYQQQQHDTIGSAQFHELQQKTSNPTPPPVPPAELGDRY